MNEMDTADLLGIAIGNVSVAREALASYGSLQALDRAPVGELIQVKGLGTSRATRVKAVFELGRRAAMEGVNSGKKIRCAEDVHAALGPTLRAEEREVFYVLGLDARGRIKLVHQVAIGSLTQCVIHPRDVFAPLLREAAVSAILVHNHPSGDPTPSAEDLRLTRKLKQAGDLLGVKVLDHIILGADGFTSLAEVGIL